MSHRIRLLPILQTPQFSLAFNSTFPGHALTSGERRSPPSPSPLLLSNFFILFAVDSSSGGHSFSRQLHAPFSHKTPQGAKPITRAFLLLFAQRGAVHCWNCEKFAIYDLRKLLFLTSLGWFFHRKTIALELHSKVGTVAEGFALWFTLVACFKFLIVI